MDQNKELRELLTNKHREGHFVFVPFGGIPKTNGLFVPTSERVFLTIEDFYKTQGKFGLRHFAFMKLAEAAGVQWSSDGLNVGRMDNRNNPNYCSFRAVGKIRTAEGLFTELAANKHIDLDSKRLAIETKHAEAYDYKAKFGGGKGPNGWAVKKPWPKNKNEYVKKFTDRDIGQLRDNMDERCESGAQSRVVKNMMHIPANFAPMQNDDTKPVCLGKEWHIVRYILDPQNPNVQQAQLACFTKAMSGIYGQNAIPHTPQPAIPQSEEPRNITPKPDKHPFSNDTLDSSLIDFENSSTEEKITAIVSCINLSGYPNFNDDISNSGTELIKWSDDKLVEYFKHLKLWQEAK